LCHARGTGYFAEDAIRQRDPQFYYDSFGQFVGEAPPDLVEGKQHPPPPPPPPRGQCDRRGLSQDQRFQSLSGSICLGDALREAAESLDPLHVHKHHQLRSVRHLTHDDSALSGGLDEPEFFTSPALEVHHHPENSNFEELRGELERLAIERFLSGMDAAFVSSHGGVALVAW
jgi:hypothetical protein